MRIIKEKNTWYHFSSPTSEELEFIKSELKTPEPVMLELQSPSSRQKMESYPGLLYAIVKFPIYEKKKKTCRAVEIDFIITASAIATIAYEEVQPLEEFFTQCEQLEGLKQKTFDNTTAELAEAIFSHVFTYGMRELTHIDKNINEISGQLYQGVEKSVIPLIALVKRDVLDFRRILKPAEGILHALRDASQTLYGNERIFRFNNIIGAYENVWDVVENQKDTIESLETTNQALLASKINEVMKILSLMAFLLAPFTIIASMFQMNLQFTPIAGMPGDWWIVMAIIAACCIGLFIYFKKKKWI